MSQAFYPAMLTNLGGCPSIDIKTTCILLVSANFFSLHSA